jgi:hypothetical protein
MSAADLISRLDRCKQTSATSWLARCPAHEDRSPSLTITEAQDGRVLIHCFAGCDPESVLSAAGLDFNALFPDPPLTNHYEPHRLRFNARDVLRAVSKELTVCCLFLGDVAGGKEVSDEDRTRFKLACERIEEARQYANA